MPALTSARAASLKLVFRQGQQHLARGGKTFRDLADSFIMRLARFVAEGEEMAAALIADQQQIAEARRDKKGDA